MSAQTYQVGAHFEALIEGVLMAPLKLFERFFASHRAAGRLEMEKNSQGFWRVP